MLSREKDGRFVARPRRSEDDVNDAQPTTAYDAGKLEAGVFMATDNPRTSVPIDSETYRDLVYASDHDIIYTEDAIMNLLRANEGHDVRRNLAAAAIFCIRELKRESEGRRRVQEEVDHIEREQKRLSEESERLRRKARG